MVVMQSRLEGKSILASDFIPRKETPTASGHPDSSSDSGATEDLGDEDDQILRACREEWWVAAQQRFTDEHVGLMQLPNGPLQTICCPVADSVVRNVSANA